MINEDMGLTNPDAGVIVASPAIEPVAAPNIVGFPLCIHSMITQISVAETAEVCVATNAMVLRVPADNALPALNPNHPNQRRPAPRTVMGRLCGYMASCKFPFLLPMINAAARAEIPDIR